MSIAPPPAKPTSGSPPVSKADQLIDQRIVEACSALWWAELTRTLLRLVIVGIALMLAWIVVDQWIYSPGQLLRAILLAGMTLGLGWYLWRRVVPLLSSSIEPDYAARSLERDLPDLHQDLTSYVTLRDQRNAKSLRSRVVRSIGSRAAGQLKKHDVLPEEATGTLRLWIATAGVLALLVGYSVVSPKNSVTSAARLVAPLAEIAPAKRVSIKDVQPGDVEAIAGRVVKISAKIDGMNSQEGAQCEWELPASRQLAELKLDTDSGLYRGEIRLPHSAQGQIAYVISAGDATAGPYHLQVKNAPVVALQSVKYGPPSYTGEPPHTSSSGAIQGLDGTRVTILATTNRAISKAKIEFNPKKIGDRIQATAGATEMSISEDGTSLSLTFPLKSARGRSAAVEPESYRIKVWDQSKQTNPDPIVYPISVIADLPPEISIVLPTKSPQDLPINLQQAIEIHASDPDYGLKQVALEIRSGIDLIAQPVLWSDEKGAKGNRVTEFGFRPTRHGLRIGDKVQVIAVAIDNRIIEHDPSIEPNTVRSDPIELRIVADDSPPPEGDPEANGISEPKENPKGEKGKEESSDSGGGEGEKSSGGGSGGSGDGETKPGEGDLQGGQSGNSSGDNSGEGDNSSSQDSGGGDNADASDSPSESEGGGSSEGGSNSNSGSNSKTGEMPQEGTGESSDQNQDGSSDPEESSDAAPGQENGGAGKSSPSDSDAGNPSQQNPGSEKADSENQNGGTSSSESSDGGGGESQSKNKDSSGQDSESNQTGGDSQQSSDGSNPQDGEGDQAPEHDGDAFEKIRDHIEQKRKERESQSGSNSNQADPQQSDPGDSSSSASKQPEGQPGESSDTQNQNGSNNSNQQDRDESQSNPRGDQSGSDESSGNQSSESENQSGSEGDSEGKKPSGDQSTGDRSADDTTNSDAQSEPGQSQDSMNSKEGAGESGEKTDGASPQEGDRNSSPENAAEGDQSDQGGQHDSETGSKDQDPAKDNSSGDKPSDSKNDSSSGDQGG